MRYPLGAIDSLSVGNTTVNSTDTFFSILDEDDIVYIGLEDSAVNAVYSDVKFTVKTAFATGSSGDVIYTEDKCVYLKYQIWKLETSIRDYNLKLMGVEKLQSDKERVEYMDTKTAVDQLMALKRDYESQLADCMAEQEGSGYYMMRRAEYGTY